MNRHTPVGSSLATLAVGCLLLLAACTPAEDEPRSFAGDPVFDLPSWSGRWFKGNTHAHTTNSDGDSTPDYVAAWYKEHGYDFLVLSDHNVFTDPATLAHLVDDSFLLIPGEEVTSSFDSASVHVNGLNLPHLVEARQAETLIATIQANVDAIREVDGVPHINHPNFRWSFGAEELAQVEHDRLLEIWNGHPTVHNDGGGASPSLEEIWDILLTGGKTIFGIAVDDAHHFQGEFHPDRANPGRGWVAVRAAALDAAELMASLEAGHFYASTGVELVEIAVRPTSLEVHIAQDRDFRYVTMFIGASGEILLETEDNPAVFQLTEDVGYVRARVSNSRSDYAWTQPVFVTRR
ncbi:MAG: CehA/McbA family metallohydrolase [Longimicrobiales bacterium]|nr:CehA/McbA family metallohydrolase [Longimicrobiales bacterium]